MIDENSKFFYSKRYSLRFSEMDYNRVLKPSALLNFLQDIATNAAEVHNFGYSFISTNNYAWFLLKYSMRFYNYPVGLDEILIKTEARGVNKIFANRNFEICTKEGELIARINSHWSLIDLTNKEILQPDKIFECMPKFEKREDDLSFNKIHSLARVDYEKEFQIRFDDIDVNRHVNNANYIVWAFETLPYEFKNKYKLKNLDINYKKEVKYGNTIISQIELDEENKTSLHSVKNLTTGEDLCLIKTEFEEINL